MKHITLFCREWLGDFSGERLPTTEPELTAGLKPLLGWSEPEEDELGMKVAAIVRTGGVFVLDRTDYPLWQQSIPFDGGLPPLPYPRIWIEATANGVPTPLFVKNIVEEDGEYVCFTMGILVNEVSQGERWELLHVDYIIEDEDLGRFIESSESDSENFAVVYELMFAAQSAIFRESVYDIAVDEPLEQWESGGEMRDAPFHSPVMLLDLLGATYEPVPVVRQERRKFERKYGWRPATAYYINLRSTGDEPPRSGDGTRKFSCRWLVRGHYARHRYGSIWRERKKAWCVWVPPHIKGPVGAPWKGRPIYLDIPPDEEEWL